MRISPQAGKISGDIISGLMRADATPSISGRAVPLIGAFCALVVNVIGHRHLKPYRERRNVIHMTSHSSVAVRREPAFTRRHSLPKAPRR